MKLDELICVSKDRYENISIALSVAHEFNIEDGYTSEPYLCRICNSYHLTRKSKIVHRRVSKKTKRKQFNQRF